jgi:hypothetical protein
MPRPEVIPALAELPAWLFNAFFATNRWLHLVAGTLLVGGVLFFVFVVPIATAELKVEHQLTVFGKARWMFRKIVGWSVLALLVTGGLSLWRMWSIYRIIQADAPSFWSSSTPWALAHLTVAVLGAAILIRVTATRKIRNHPVPWMWVVLALLLAGMLLASISRQLRLDIDDRTLHQSVPLAAK